VKHLLRLPLAVLVMVLSTACTAAGENRKPDDAASDKAQKLLFVGNSFTYYNNSLHHHVRNLLIAAGKFEPGNTSLRAMTISGSGLAEHLPGVTAMVNRSDWDLVIMHGYSNGPVGLESAVKFEQAAREISAVVRKAGAEPAFLMTWAYKDNPEMGPKLGMAYSAIGEELGAHVVPVGLAFDRANRELTDIELYSPDIQGFSGSGEELVITYQDVIKHPSRAGTYLAACVVYASLFGASPEGLVYGADLPQNDVRRLQRLAWEVVSDYHQS
jgi:hypothetical protein